MLQLTKILADTVSYNTDIQQLNSRTEGTRKQLLLLLSMIKSNGNPLFFSISVYHTLNLIVTIDYSRILFLFLTL